MLSQLAEVQREPIKILEQHKTEQADRLEVYQSLNTMVTGLGINAGMLQQPEDLLVYSAASSNSSALAVSADDVAGPGQYDVTIDQLATSHKISSDVIADDTAALGYEGDILVNDSVVSIEAADTLNTVAAKINLSGSGVYATVIDYAADDHRLVLTGQETGADNVLELADANASGILEDLGVSGAATSLKHTITDGAQSDAFSGSSVAVGEMLDLQTPPSGTVQINGTDVAIDLSADSLADIADQITSTVADVSAQVTSTTEGDAIAYRLEITGSAGTPTFTDANNVLETIGVVKHDAGNEIQTAQDAQITVDGVTVSRSSNSISDLIDGITLDLRQADPGQTHTVTVSQDTGAVINNVSSILDTYNSIVDNLNAGQSWDAETGQGGVYFGDPAVQMLQDGLHAAVMNPVDSLAGGLSLPSEIGITTDQSGHLQLDQAAFTEALAENPLAVGRMFGTAGETSDADVSYIDSSKATAASGPDGYDIEITQAAEKASATSATLASGITMDETLTVNGSCSVQLTAGMSLQEAADEINSRMQVFGYNIEASVEGDTIALEHGSYGDSYGFEISSSLDAGLGGVDLGGATAGDVAEYVGVDVAGTINGEDATGRGQYLAGNAGNDTTDGLVVRVEGDATGNRGTVNLGKGIASRVASYVGRVSDAQGGSMTLATRTIEADIEAIDEEIADMEADVERYLDRMRRDFLAMERAIAEAQNLEQFITNQLKGMTTNYASGSPGGS
jgi:flagellar hook-associated protein 2